MKKRFYEIPAYGKHDSEIVAAYYEPPAGWRKIIGAQTAPHGFEWWSNGESIFGKNYEQALIKEPDAEEVHGVREVVAYED